MTAIPADAAAALTSAGSRALSAPARTELERRVALYGCSPAAHNIGGIGCTLPGSHASHGAACVPWRSRRIEIFPDYDTSARRLIRLCRLVTGEGGPAASMSSDSTAGFRSMAPEEGSPPAKITHTPDVTSGAETGAEDTRRSDVADQLTREHGPERARVILDQLTAGLPAWIAASPQARHNLRVQADQAERAAGRPAAAPPTTAYMDQLAGVCDADDAGAIAGRLMKPTTTKKTLRRPTPARVLRARDAARLARDAHALELVAQGHAYDHPPPPGWQPDPQFGPSDAPGPSGPVSPEEEAEFWAAHGGDPNAESTDNTGASRRRPTRAQIAAHRRNRPAVAPSTLPPMPELADPAPPHAPTSVAAPVPTADELAARLSRLEATAAEATAAAEELAGLFGTSDASAHAFQDLSAQWAALAAYPGAASTPGFAAALAEWKKFQRAWQTGDQTAPACNGGAVPGAQPTAPKSFFDAPACESALGAHIHDMERLRKEIATKDPQWAAKIAPPAPLTEAQKNPIATSADATIVPAFTSIPGASWLTQPSLGFSRKITIALGAALAVITGGAIALYRTHQRA